MLALSFISAVAAPLQKGDFVFFDKFETSVEELQKTWKDSSGGEIKVTLEKGYEGQAIAISVPKSAGKGNNKIERKLSIDALKGGTFYLSTMVKAVDVSAKPNPWNGLKLMLQLVTDSGAKSHPQVRLGVGSFEWTQVGFLLTIPKNISSLTLTLGLEDVTGTVMFDNLNLEVVEAPLDESTLVKNSGPKFKGHTEPALRGMMISTNITEDSIKTLGQDWNANLVRWQIGQAGTKLGLEHPDFENNLENNLAQFDSKIPLFKKYGLHVCLDLHAFSEKLFASQENQDKLVAVWKKIATRYKDQEIVWSYDIANEPRLEDWKHGVALWYELSERIAKEIRLIDPVKAIVVEAEQNAIPEAFEVLRPINVPNVIYSVHMYNPHLFTHNKVYDKKQQDYTYPGNIGGVQWDIDQVEKALKPVIDFQKKYGVQIYVGEFSATRWSPGVEKYLRDCVTIFEKYDWDWSYHAFRESPVWSIEHLGGPDETKLSPEPTEREKDFKEIFKKNVKPIWTGK
jgi:hypothetical protein